MKYSQYFIQKTKTDEKDRRADEKVSLLLFLM